MQIDADVNNQQYLSGTHELGVTMNFACEEDDLPTISNSNDQFHKINHTGRSMSSLAGYNKNDDFYIRLIDNKSSSEKFLNQIPVQKPNQETRLNIKQRYETKFKSDDKLTKPWTLNATSETNASRTPYNESFINNSADLYKLDKLQDLKMKQILNMEADLKKQININKKSDEMALTMKYDLENCEMQLELKNNEIIAIERQTTFYKYEIEKQERELLQKNKTIDELTRRISELQDEVKDLKRKTLGLETVIKEQEVLTAQISKMDNDLMILRATCKQLDDEKLKLADELEAQIIKSRTLQKVIEERNELQRIVEELKIVAADKSKWNLQTQENYHHLRHTTGLLTEKSSELTILHEELSAIKQRNAYLEKENVKFKEVKIELEIMQSNFDQLQFQKSTLESQLLQLVNEMEPMRQQNKKKDVIVKRLVSELSSRGDYLLPTLVNNFDILKSENSRHSPYYGQEFGGRELIYSSAQQDYNSYKPVDFNDNTNGQLEQFLSINGYASNSMQDRNATIYSVPNLVESYKVVENNERIDAPRDLQISNVTSNGNVMIQWTTPFMNDFDQNNDVKLTGYSILVGGIPIHKVNSPRISRTLINKTNLKANSNIAIQTLGENGQVSAICELSNRQYSYD